MKKYIYLTSLLSLMLLFAGCEKEMDMQGMSMEENTLVPLNIVFGGMEDYGDITSPETRSAETMVQTFVQPLDSTQDTGIDIVTTVEALPAIKAAETRATLNDNASFRVHIYNSQGTEVYNLLYCLKGTTAILTEGTRPMLSPGTYKFVCLTLNENTGINPSVVANVFNKHEFSTFCTTKTISGSDNTIAIHFKRQMSRLQLAVNTSGFANNNAMYSSATVDNLGNKGVWYVNANSLDETEMVVNGANSITMQNNTWYTALPVTRVLSVSLNNLTIDGTDYGTKVVSVPVNLVRKGSYKITVQFTKAGYIEVGGIKWAPGNLKNADGVYKIASSQYDKGSFWPIDDKSDPCKLVSPENTWRLPKKAEYEKLLSLGLTFATTPVRGAYYGNLFLLAENYTNLSGEVMAEEDFVVYRTSDYAPSWGNGLDFCECLDSAQGLGIVGLRSYQVSVRCVRN